MKIIELFAGIGSQTQALKNLGIDHEVVCVVEWDKYAYASYQMIHGPTPNLGDITKVESLPECDLLTYSFPCQDISVAGAGKGLSKGSGTRSGLLWEVERLLDDYADRMVLPKYLLMENVKNLVSKKHRSDFEEWLRFLESLGYENHWKVLNAKDYGIPQNRERVFCVSIHGGGDYTWPEPFDNGIRLKDMLETEVDEKYYLEDSKVEKLLLSSFNQEKARIQTGYTCGALLARGYKDPKCVPDPHGVPIKANNSKGFDLAEPGDTINFENLASTTRRGRVGKGVAQTINTMTSQAVVEPNELKIVGSLEHYGNDQMNRVYDPEGVSPTITVPSGGGREQKILMNYRIRKLTPKECWRLMGFSDDEFEMASLACSNSQLYKQAGNSIVVQVLEAIFDKLFTRNESLLHTSRG